MDNSTIRFPVKCPCCGQESLVASRFDAILKTLATKRRLMLSSICANHHVMWVANEIERNQIREYAAALHFSMNEKSRPRRYGLPAPDLTPSANCLAPSVSFKKRRESGRRVPSVCVR
jgi:hypothetical protein